MPSSPGGKNRKQLRANAARTPYKTPERRISNPSRQLGSFPFLPPPPVRDWGERAKKEEGRCRRRKGPDRRRWSRRAEERRPRARRRAVLRLRQDTAGDPKPRPTATSPYPEPEAVPRRRQPCYLYVTGDDYTSAREARLFNPESKIPEDDQEDPEYLPEEEANEQDSGDDEPDNLVTRDNWIDLRSQKKKKAEELMHESSYLVLKVDDEVESFYQQFVLKNGVKKLPSFVAIGDINLSYKEFQQCFKKYVNVTEKVMEIYGDTPLAVDLWAQKIRQDLAWLDPDPVSAWNAGRRRGPSGSQHVAGGVGARALRSLRAGRPVAVRAGKRTADTQTEATGES
ncbi:hypothetical protein U9M48_040644 [Paspalum notatum var. saurae]|uniref:Uncharacterized protein n=1 Tax=Paspalum notatum var. saurae TaxID=547442 RepID=A0AAQ3UNW0_PASNO